jgi:hypothetical protein
MLTVCARIERDRMCATRARVMREFMRGYCVRVTNRASHAATDRDWHATCWYRKTSGASGVCVADDVRVFRQCVLTWGGDPHMAAKKKAAKKKATKKKVAKKKK